MLHLHISVQSIFFFWGGGRVRWKGNAVTVQSLSVMLSAVPVPAVRPVGAPGGAGSAETGVGLVRCGAVLYRRSPRASSEYSRPT